VSDPPSKALQACSCNIILIISIGPQSLSRTTLSARAAPFVPGQSGASGHPAERNVAYAASPAPGGLGGGHDGLSAVQQSGEVTPTSGAGTQGNIYSAGLPSSSGSGAATGVAGDQPLGSPFNPQHGNATESETAYLRAWNASLLDSLTELSHNQQVLIQQNLGLTQQNAALEARVGELQETTAALQGDIDSTLRSTLRMARRAVQELLANNQQGQGQGQGPVAIQHPNNERRARQARQQAPRRSDLANLVDADGGLDLRGEERNGPLEERVVEAGPAETGGRAPSGRRAADNEADDDGE